MHDARGQHRLVRVDELVAQLLYGCQRQGGRGVGVEHGRLVHRRSSFLEGRGHGQLHHIEEGAVQRRQLYGQRTDRDRMDPRAVDQGRHLHARLLGEIADQTGVGQREVHLARRSGDHRVDHLGSHLEMLPPGEERLAGRQGAPEPLVRVELPGSASQGLVDRQAEPPDLVLMREEP